MMDIDDGYILWTGIWKGKLPERVAYMLLERARITLQLALGNAKGKLIPSVNVCRSIHLSPYSRYREDARVATRPRPSASASSGRLSQDTRHLDALRGLFGIFLQF